MDMAGSAGTRDGLDAGTSWPRVGVYVEAYESAAARDGVAEPAAYAPPPDHPDRLAILCELIRVDLEYRWEAGEPRPIDHYRDQFPSLFAETRLVAEMAFEEYRLRLQVGERPSRAEYARRFGVETSGWPEAGSNVPGSAPADASSQMALAARAYREHRRSDPGIEALDLRFENLGVSEEHAELLKTLDQNDPHAAERLAEALGGFPRVGTRFLGFEVCGELGRGAFGRVYLARQGDLADRLVALKVSADVAGESRALARLQHTNVVPIYSVHRRGPLQVVCMPYLGSTTLADTLSALRSQPTLPRSGEGLLSSLRPRSGTGSSPRSARGSSPRTDAQSRPNPASGTDESTVASTGEIVSDLPLTQVEPPQVERLRGLGYVPAVLWLVSRVADGLAHAHERGILHRDLKPANILFADDGEPLLLDFNLAADTTLPVGASLAMVGGTLPYMAPEHLEAYRESRPALDPRSDVYALGVILFELLTGALPFPIRKGSVDSVLPAMVADRAGTPPDPRSLNPAVPAAVASIVRMCLEPDPSRRYPSARALQEDLRRQLDDLPLLHVPEPSIRERLGKWSRRHPRLTSSTTVGLLALVVVLGLSWLLVSRQSQYRRATAVSSFQNLQKERTEAFALLADPKADPDLVAEGLRVVRGAARRYGVGESSSSTHWRWQNQPLAAALPDPETPKLLASLAEVLTLGGRALSAAPAEVAGPERLAEAKAFLSAARACSTPDPPLRSLLKAEADLARANGVADAEVAELTRRAEEAPAGTTRERLLAQAERIRPEDRRNLRAFLDAAESVGPADLDPAHWLILGNWSVALAKSDEARHCYGVAIALDPKLPWPYFNRGLLYLDSGDPSQAIRDFDKVIELRPDNPAAWLNRALAKLAQEDAEGAVQDLNRCLTLKEAPTRAWFVRAKARERLGDRPGARADRDEGLKRTPRDPNSFVARGLARLPGDPKGALADFDAALVLDPKHRDALQDKASVLSESLGRAEEAVKVLDTALTHRPDAADALAGRAVLLARLGRAEEARRDARTVLALDDRPLISYQAACAFALNAKAHAEDRPEALRLLAEAFRKDVQWLQVAPRDPDLAPIRSLPEFRELMDAFAVVGRVTGSQSPPRARR